MKTSKTINGFLICLFLVSFIAFIIKLCVMSNPEIDVLKSKKKSLDTEISNMVSVKANLNVEITKKQNELRVLNKEVEATSELLANTLAIISEEEKNYLLTHDSFIECGHKYYWAESYDDAEQKIEKVLNDNSIPNANKIANSCMGTFDVNSGLDDNLAKWMASS